MPPTPSNASIPAGTVRHRFDFEWATSSPLEDVDTYWWWARDVRVDPNEIWADDEQGNLWVVPFDTDGADGITFGTPVRSVEVAVPVDAGVGASATAAVDRRRQRVLARATTPPTKPDHAAHPRASTGPQGQGADTMNIDDLRAALGLGDDVPYADVMTAAVSRLTDDEESDDEAGTADATATDAAGSDAAQVPAPPAPATATQLENAALRATVERLAATEADRATREAAATREQVLSAAVNDGRITPAERTELWEPFYDADAETATARLSQLPANRVPVVERGHAAGAEDPQATAFAARRARMTGRKEA